jgi:hypothetical protein
MSLSRYNENHHSQNEFTGGDDRLEMKFSAIESERR